MKHININGKSVRTVLVTLMLAMGLLLLLNLFYAKTSRAQEEKSGISAAFYYSEPTSLLMDMKLTSSSDTDVTANNIEISGVDIWRGTHPLYLVAVHYTDPNNDEKERRFVFVVRSSGGAPWITANTPLDRGDEANKTIWFDFDVDKAILEADARIVSSWFTDAATSTIEIGVTDQNEINIGGFGELSADERASLTPLYKIATVLIFDN